MGAHNTLENVDEVVEGADAEEQNTTENRAQKKHAIFTLPGARFFFFSTARQNWVDQGSKLSLYSAEGRMGF